MKLRPSPLWGVLALSLAGWAQEIPIDATPWKSRSGGRAERSHPAGPRRNLSVRHVLVEVGAEGGGEVRARIERAGGAVLGAVPGRGFVARVPELLHAGGIEGARLVPLASADKISAAIDAEAAGEAVFVVELHPGVPRAGGQALALESGFLPLETPGLLDHQMLVRGRSPDLDRLAAWDEVAYVYPASAELARGEPALPCAGALSDQGWLAPMAAASGPGWDGPGRNTVTLHYVLGAMTPKVPAETARAELLRALAEWASYVRVTFVPGADPSASRTLNIFFAEGSHGDPYPFDGPGRVLAHTFYPSPPNPEPLAGDMHLDAAEGWRIGLDIDVFSVALHETGHALGLGHSDNPQDVMYAFYRRAERLAAGDIAAIRALYASRAEPAPVALQIAWPPPATAADRVVLSGTVAGGTPQYTVELRGGAAAVAPVSTAGPFSLTALLQPGANVLTVAAVDAGGARVSESFTVTRSTAAAPRDTTPPSLTVLSPAATTLATSAAEITVSGTASDNVGVTAVTWSTNLGASGTAAGAASWTATVPLLPGSNSITIRARDAAGNQSWRSLVVTRR
jgi:hypothetical protein